MPTGYAGEGKTFSRKLGKWVTKNKNRAFDYERMPNQDSAALIISFFRWYPDYLADMLRDENARYGLELPQRLMMRIDARYRNVYVTGSRGLTKTFTKILTKELEGATYPGEIMRYAAPNQKQAASLAAQAHHEVERNYPILGTIWKIKNDRSDMFRMETNYGSEFGMYSPRGDNSSQTIAEEMAQEGSKDDTFDMEKYERDIFPTCRIVRTINNETDRTHINRKHSHISNASTRQNPAFSKYRRKALYDMLYGEKYEGFVLDMPWVVALMAGLRDIGYFKDMKKSLSAENWLREACARYTGSSENPMIPDDVLSRSRKLMTMEKCHCGDNNAIYIVAHDVSYETGTRNAKCADAVIKLTRYKSIAKRDKYRKQVVYVDSYPPPKTAYLQAQKLRGLYFSYCKNGAQTTYLVVDARAVGKDVVDELMKPPADGMPPLCTYNHMAYTDIEQPNALPVIYPLKAGTRGAADEEGEMIRYAQLEFEQGNVELLTASILDGVAAYKVMNGIKNDAQDAQIALPYRKTDELCQQIQNLKTEVSGITLKEKRKSKAIQRDDWSATKYGLRFAQILETLIKKTEYQAKSSWAAEIEKYKNGGFVSAPQASGTRANLLALRKR